MRILFATTRGAGHVGPLIPFAYACLRAGHDVLVAAARSCGPHVARAGLRFAPLDDPPEEAMEAVWARVRAADPEEAGRIVVEEVFAGEFARAALPGMLELVRRWRPDVVVRETCEYASLIAAESAGVPDVHVACFLGVLCDTEWDMYQPLGQLRAEFGLPRRHRDRTGEPYLTLAPRLARESRASSARRHPSVPGSEGPGAAAAALVG
jgi:UDP:flavonoid glycosyltransferase YjiC (YdhE family)